MTTKITFDYSCSKYEIEYKITNKFKLFKQLQKYMTLEEFEKSEIKYVKSKNSNTNIRIISRENEKVEYEQKKVIIKENIEINTYPYKIQVKVAKESPIELKKYEVTSTCKRYRLIFSIPDFPFEIDLSMRVFPNKNCILPDFTDEDVMNPTYNSNHDYHVIYDMEFEMKKDCKLSNQEAFDKLIELLNKSNDDYKKEYKDIKNKINVNSLLIKNTSKRKKGGNEDILKILIDKTFDFTKTPQVNVLTNRVLDSIDLKDYVYLEKTDGLRTLLIGDDENIYLYRSREGLIKTNIKNINKILFVVDSEFFNDDYYLFDAYYINNDIRELPFIERMKLAEQLKNISHFKIKEFKEIDDLGKLIEYGMTKRDNVDGVVLQSKEGYYKWLEKDYQYKLKPLELTTTDFLYSYRPDKKCYYLYLIGKLPELLFNLKRRPRLPEFKYPKNNDDKNGMLILFDSPLFDNMYYAKVDNDLKIEGYDKKLNEGCLDGMIIETSYFVPGRERQQTPIRIRADKLKPNGYRIGLANACILFSPPNKDHYFHKIENSQVEKTFGVDDGEKLINSFHVINQRIRDYTFDVLGKYCKGYNALDLCGGRGADLKRLFKLNYTNIIAVDADAEALAGYSLKAILYRTLENAKNKNKLNLNCICKSLGTKNDLKLIDMIKQRYEYQKFDVVVIDYALHYICNDDNNLINLVKIIKSVCNKNAHILINCYDGDMIKEKKGDFEVFKIKIDGNNAKMPLPTIEKDGYREEPLLLNKHVEILKNEGLEIIKDYHPFDDKDFTEGCEKYMNDYLKCIRSIILKV